MPKLPWQLEGTLREPELRLSNERAQLQGSTVFVSVILIDDTATEWAYESSLFGYRVDS